MVLQGGGGGGEVKEEDALAVHAGEVDSMDPYAPNPKPET